MANLGNPQETIAVLQRYGFNFQKKYGQNFLIDTHVLDKIIGAAEIGKDDFVLEIGPGIGTMTQYLAEAAREVVAVEIDTKLIPILEDTLKEYDNVTVLNEDILKVDIRKIAEEKNGGKPIKVDDDWLIDIKLYSEEFRELRTCLTILQHQLLWGYLRVKYHWTLLQLWCRKKSLTVCR